MSRWTLQQVAKIAPDESSMAAARKLARPGPWSDTGATDLLLWGVCQGSGKTPYQVSVDLTGSAYRCSCPSRKFPCKHALALLLLWVEGPDTIAQVGEASGFAQDWADARAGREAALASRRESTEPPDPAAQAKRLEARLTLMDSGMTDFATWLSDLVRTGTAAARQQPYGWWEATAARLVDAQLPGLAEQVRTMASEIHRRADWADHLLGSCGRWWTATRAWANREALDGESLADLRVFIGWSQASSDVREQDQEAAPARWMVLGAHRDDEGRLQQQRTWLRREDTDEVVQVLDFAAAGTALRVPQLAGSILEVTMARYPGAPPRRALFATEPVATGAASTIPGCETIDGALSQVAARLGKSPWSDRVPVALSGVRLAPGSPACLSDSEGNGLPLVPDAPIWQLMALTGGSEVDLFGELDAGEFRPLTVLTDAGLVAL